MFIDAFYDSEDEHETNKFSENVQKLWEFSTNADPFECKDIKTALTELMEAQVCYNNIYYLTLKILCNIIEIFVHINCMVFTLRSKSKTYKRVLRKQKMLLMKWMI